METMREDDRKDRKGKQSLKYIRPLARIPFFFKKNERKKKEAYTRTHLIKSLTFNAAGRRQGQMVFSTSHRGIPRPGEPVLVRNRKADGL